MPMMAIMLRCASNVQVCDLRFIVACLIKCVTGKEMRKVPTFSSGALSGEVISDRGTGAAANEKISGVKIFKDIEREKESENDKRINDNVLEVSQFEVCCYALGFK